MRDDEPSAGARWRELRRFQELLDRSSLGKDAFSGDWSTPSPEAEVQDAFTRIRTWVWTMRGNGEISQDEFQEARRAYEISMKLPGGPWHDSRNVS